MKSIKGTKTELNLMEAFAGESMARNKYTYFASKAKKDGYVQIAELILPPSRSLNHILACSFSLLAVASNSSAICT